MRWQHFSADLTFPVLTAPAYRSEAVDASLADVEHIDNLRTCVLQTIFGEERSGTRATQNDKKQQKCSSMKV